MNKENLKVMQEDNLKVLLEKLGLLEDLNNGKIKCKFCKSEVLFDDIYGVFPESGSVKIVCNKPECILQLMEYLRKGKTNK